MTEPGYTSRPTLLYFYQGRIRNRRMSGSGKMLPPLQPAEAVAELTAEINAGRLEVLPELPPDWRLLSRPNDQLVVKGKGSKAKSSAEYYCLSITTMGRGPDPWSPPPRPKPARPKPARPKPTRRTSELANSDRVKQVVEALKDHSLINAETKLWEKFRSGILELTHREFRAGVKLARKRSAKR